MHCRTPAQLHQTRIPCPCVVHHFSPTTSAGHLQQAAWIPRRDQYHGPGKPSHQFLGQHSQCIYHPQHR
uniref:Uncharacterized protein n=1 Tax=Arundo donax TaxID=35708 RepID=A0A0A9F9S0_ARUDO